MLDSHETVEDSAHMQPGKYYSNFILQDENAVLLIIFLVICHTVCINMYEFESRTAPHSTPYSRNDTPVQYDASMTVQLLMRRIRFYSHATGIEWCLVNN